MVIGDLDPSQERCRAFKDQRPAPQLSFVPPHLTKNVNYLLLKLAHCPRSLAATLAALPSMSRAPRTPFLRSCLPDLILSSCFPY
jgi:hypothetical protein